MKIILIIGFAVALASASPAAPSAVNEQNSVTQKPTPSTESPPAVVEPTEQVVNETEVHLEDDDGLQARQALNDPCNQGHGVCLTQLECSRSGGVVRGFCNAGTTCCEITKTCELESEVEITQNHTFFVDPKLPQDDKPLHCAVKVKKPAGLFVTPVCQIRLDFIQFKTIGPDPRTGECLYDYLSVEQSDANSKVNHLCGFNDGQHIYLDVKYTEFIKLRMNIDYSRQPNHVRQWKIRTTFIPCNSPRLAPPGCLQYYEDFRGTIKSFNYGATGVNETSYPLSQRYAMCFRRGPDSCRIILKKAGEFGLGDVPTEAHTRMDAFPDVDTECYDKRTMVRSTPSKAYLAIDNIKMCGRTFFDEYRSEDNGVNVINFVSPDFESVRENEPPLQPPGFKFDYRLVSCSTPKV